MSGTGVDRRLVHEELERSRATLHRLVAGATLEDLGRGSNGTRWTNGQLLFHMVFGYMVVLRLLPLVRLFGRLPTRLGQGFAGLLDLGTRPFHVVNYLGSCGGALVFRGARLRARMDRTVDALHRHLERETDAALARRMHFPVRWDPFFADTMSLLDVYHYGTQHFDFHLRQLTLDREA